MVQSDIFLALAHPLVMCHIPTQPELLFNICISVLVIIRDRENIMSM